MHLINDFHFPDELEMLSFFGSEPVQYSPDEGFWRYKIEDKNNNLLLFSFNIFEKSVQVEISNLGKQICVVSQEGAKRVYIDRNRLYVNLDLGDFESTLLLKYLNNEFSLHWGTIRIRS